MHSSSAPQRVPVRDIIDHSRMSAYQVMVLLLCFTVVLLDGFDTAAVGYIAPALRQEWHLTPPMLAPAFGAGLFGLLIGSLCFGPVADRFGRKPLLLAAVLLFGVATLVTSSSDSLSMLVVMRFITGIGLGGAMPICITLSSEYSPQRLRTLMVTLSWSGFTTGLALGGLVAGEILPTYGWRGVLIAGGVAPLLLLPVIAAWMPESVQFLARRTERAAALKKILDRIAGNSEWESLALVSDGATVQRGTLASVGLLFSQGKALRTLLLWLTFFSSLFVFYLLTSWLPTLMKDSGLSLSDSAHVGAMVPLGGTVGAIVLALLMDRAGAARVLIVSYFGAAFAVAAVGTVMHDVTWLMATVFLVGFGVAGAQNGINLLAAQMYPTEARVTGVSWALSAGRAGSIVGSMAGGLLMAAAGSPQMFFSTIALPLFLASAALLLLSRLNTSRTDSAGGTLIPQRP